MTYSLALPFANWESNDSTPIQRDVANVPKQWRKPHSVMGEE